MPVSVTLVIGVSGTLSLVSLENSATLALTLVSASKNHKISTNLASVGCYLLSQLHLGLLLFLPLHLISHQSSHRCIVSSTDMYVLVYTCNSSLWQCSQACMCIQSCCWLTNINSLLLQYSLLWTPSFHACIKLLHTVFYREQPCLLYSSVRHLLVQSPHIGVSIILQ